MTYYHHNSRIYLVESFDESNFDIDELFNSLTSYECRVEGLKEGVVEIDKDFVLIEHCNVDYGGGNCMSYPSDDHCPCMIALGVHRFDQHPSPGKQEGEGKEFKQLLKRFVTDFALMIQEGQNIRKEYEYYERGNSVSIEKLMLLALPAQQIAGDALRKLGDDMLTELKKDPNHITTQLNFNEQVSYNTGFHKGFELGYRVSAPAEGYSIFLDSLTDEQRMDIFNKYCKHCGSKDSGCQCWNDD